MIKPLILAFWSFGLVYIVCEFGENLTNRFEDLDEAVYQCDWYTYPNEIQNLLPIILLGSQEPIILSVFGKVSCTRESFKNVSLIDLFRWFKKK